ncbi:MAG TPA: hypothetical protein VN833_24940 [Candidatus Acidoferrales bacterium]|jgi:hypothetical protein|nr:hypothetical protein [Candidatus Acidoferrales bacterium]
MAAHRQYVPVRDTADVFQVEDGTMCRMPSPTPGPLRGQSESPEDEMRFQGKKHMTPSRQTIAHKLTLQVPGTDRN